MTLHTFDNMEQRSPEWYAARCGIVTASVVGKLLTPTLKVADNDTARGVTAQLVAERITGIVEPTYINDDMIRGIDHEPYARDVYSGHWQQAVECGFMKLEEPMPWDPNELVRSVDEDVPTWALGYSPDGVVAGDGLLEIKCPRAKGHIATILAHAGLPLFVKRVYPDPKWHEAIVAAVTKFETTAAEMVAAYTQATEHMPATERVTELEMSL
jgi:hypothetical protein